MQPNRSSFFGLRWPGRAPAPLHRTTRSRASQPRFGSHPAAQTQEPCGQPRGPGPAFPPPCTAGAQLTSATAGPEPLACDAASRVLPRAQRGVRNHAQSTSFSCCEFSFLSLGVISVLWKTDKAAEKKANDTKLRLKTTPLPYYTTSQLPICRTSVQIIILFFCSRIKRKRLSHPICIQRVKNSPTATQLARQLGSKTAYKNFTWSSFQISSSYASVSRVIVKVSCLNCKPLGLAVRSRPARIW